MERGDGRLDLVRARSARGAPSPPRQRATFGDRAASQRERSWSSSRMSSPCRSTRASRRASWSSISASSPVASGSSGSSETTTRPAGSPRRSVRAARAHLPMSPNSLRCRRGRAPSARRRRTLGQALPRRHRYGMPASRILRLALTSRWARVDSGTRKARAISGVLKPPSVRRVSATRPSIGRAGWQQVKISRSRSSGIAMSASVCRRSATGDDRPRVRPRSRSHRAPARRSCRRSRLRRRSRSIARFLAVVVIHCAGVRGHAPLGQISRAAMKASWTASSARSKSPRTRIRVATARPCSSRNRRSTNSWVVASLRLSRRSLRPTAGPGRPTKSMTGRTSIEPTLAPGHCAARSSASSRSLASTVEPAERLFRLGEQGASVITSRPAHAQSSR